MKFGQREAGCQEVTFITTRVQVQNNFVRPLPSFIPGKILFSMYKFLAHRHFYADFGSLYSGVLIFGGHFVLVSAYKEFKLYYFINGIST